MISICKEIEDDILAKLDENAAETNSFVEKAPEEAINNAKVSGCWIA